MTVNKDMTLPLILAIVVSSTIIWSGISPAFPEVWIAEIIPIVMIFVPLLVTFKWFKFSNSAYLFMSCWLILHTIGAHYTFANVPFDWFSELIGSERNHFDRFAHFSIGFYAIQLQNTLHAKVIVILFLPGYSAFVPLWQLLLVMRSLNGGTQYSLAARPVLNFWVHRVTFGMPSKICWLIHLAQ